MLGHTGPAMVSTLRYNPGRNTLLYKGGDGPRNYLAIGDLQFARSGGAISVGSRALTGQSVDIMFCRGAAGEAPFQALGDYFLA